MSDSAFPIRPTQRARTYLLILSMTVMGFQPALAGVVNRWSFNNAAGGAANGLVISDSIASASAVVTGTGASFTGTALRLPGGGGTNPGNLPATGTAGSPVIKAYIDLPNGIISSKTNLTVEIWAAPRSAQSNQRLFDFGRMSINPGVGSGAAVGEVTSNSTVASGTTGTANVDNLNLNISRSGNLTLQRIEGRINGGTAVTGDTAVSIATNTDYHFVFVFENGIGASPATGGRASWFFNGALVRSIDVNFRLSNIEDVNNWLGRSQFIADALANIDYNEVRIYDNALTPPEIEASLAAGPNPPGAPVVQPDSITMNLGQKASIPVRANDTNAVTLTIVQAPQFGTATVDGYGRILYTHTIGSPASDSFTYRASNVLGQSLTATVTVNFSPNLRLTAPTLNVPATPPPLAYQVAEAFGNLAFNQPTILTTPPGETQRLFVGQKAGLLRVIPNTNAATPTATTFLDLAGLLTSRNLPAYPNEALSSGGEQGLLGVAFHPNYASNGYFYVFYSVDKDATTTSPIYERVSRFSVDPGNAQLANPASELILIEQLDNYSNHNGGDLHFGPDGYLYISTGDEGDQNDTGNNSQRITKDFFCSILRIDVDRRVINSLPPLEPNANPNPVDYPSSPPADAVMRDETPPGSGIFLARYSIPRDNPYVSVGSGGSWTGTFNGTAIPAAELPYVRSEIWASGFRNPWRISFDPPTGDLWVGDVGGGAREEIDIVTRGGNYGWALREGFTNGPKSAQAPANFDTLYGTRPIHDYQHIQGPTGGASISGGFVYRGSRFPELVGAYIFADYVSGNIWSIRRSGANGATPATRLAGEGGISAFGRDPSNGDILLADLDNGRIRRLVGGAPVSGYPETLGETGIFAELTSLAPNPGLVSYEVNLPFWSDFAHKRRWFTIPDAVGTMTWSRDGLWTFPTGQIWVKHFDMPLTRSNPPVPGEPLTPAKRIETRVLVKNVSGSYGVSYRWNDTGTEATLVGDEGADFDITGLTQNGAPYTQRWRIPSRAECLSCHTPQAGHALSSDTRQFNRSGTLNGFVGNQLTLLQNAGYFSNTPEPPNVLPRHLGPAETSFPIEARVRSYLAVNCAYCHKVGGTAAPSVWDGRPEITLDQTGLINGPATNNGGIPANKLIVPGSTTHSVVLNRIAVANGFTRMPPLGSNELDQTNINIVTQWIGSAALINRQTYADWRIAQSLPATSEGDPTSDADFDGEDNYSEFVTGTAPLDGASFLRPQLSTPSGNVTITLQVPANRSAQVETSTDLHTWSLWDVPTNQGLAAPGGSLSFTGPRLGPAQFFRGRLKEN